MPSNTTNKYKLTGLSLVVAVATALSGCATTREAMPTSGPSTQQVVESTAAASIRVVDIDNKVVQKISALDKKSLFSEAYASRTIGVQQAGPGDVVEVSIWESPPAVLFNAGVGDVRSGPSGARVTTLPEQMVNAEGAISIPFAGQVSAAGKTPLQIEQAIVAKLKGKANQPQVLVRVIRNNTANVTVVGEVANSVRMPLTARGERLLDALAAAGGVRQPITKVSLQITRGDTVTAMPLETIISDPKQNVMLQPGDVVTSLFQSKSFTVLGATSRNEEIGYEAKGITLAQALARAGGLQDARADAQGVFIFRMENPAVLGQDGTNALKVPVVYRVNLRDAQSFFVAQSFPVQDKDVLYVSNAPAVELQKFLNMVSSTLSPLYMIKAMAFE